MKKNLTLIFMSVFSLLMISCNKDNVQGTYYFVEQNKNDKSFYNIGKSLGCSMIKFIEFKDGYYYNGMSGNTMRFKYKVEENKIIVGNQGAELVFNIIDDNTIEFFGCLFKKEIEILTKDEEKTTTTSENKLENIDLSKDSMENESAYINDIFFVENDIYIVLDIVQIKYINDIDFEIVNENTKLRTYKIRSDVLVRDINCKELRNSKYFIENKAKILSDNKNFRMVSTNNKGELTYINFGCWS